MLIEVGAEFVIATPKKARPVPMKRGLVLVRLVWVVGVLYWTLPMIDDELINVFSEITGTKRPGSFTKQALSLMRSM